MYAYNHMAWHGMAGQSRATQPSVSSKRAPTHSLARCTSCLCVSSPRSWSATSAIWMRRDKCPPRKARPGRTSSRTARSSRSRPSCHPTSKTSSCTCCNRSCAPSSERPAARRRSPRQRLKPCRRRPNPKTTSPRAARRRRTRATAS